ncbi:hypothetical protein OSB04_017713 [Centaurea solstitialis]|uniref:Uncharacterized protein n=1 Tax=Centaurea solstitialis TaxID=347529 RepID=A0AA38TAZ2_9ASTR|nr:hypothetical protein OSB04_017713 [Centaurea solstitialis]
MKLNLSKYSFVRTSKFLGYTVVRRGIETNPNQSHDYHWMDDHGRTMSSPFAVQHSHDKEIMRLYLAIIQDTLSDVLVRQHVVQQVPIYYVSKPLFYTEASSELESTTQAEVNTLWIMHVDGSSNIRELGLGVTFKSSQGAI